MLSPSLTAPYDVPGADLVDVNKLSRRYSAARNHPVSGHGLKAVDATVDLFVKKLLEANDSNEQLRVLSRIRRDISYCNYNFSVEDKTYIEMSLWNNFTSIDRVDALNSSRLDECLDRLKSTVKEASLFIEELRPLFQTGAASHCNAIPISSFARGNDTNGNPNIAPQKSLIPAAELSEAVRYQHKHLAHDGLALNGANWFLIEDDGKYLFDAALKHAIGKNGNECRPYKCFTIALVDFRCLVKPPRSCRVENCRGFWNTKQHMPIKSVYVVQCGKTGRVFELTSSISLV